MSGASSKTEIIDAQWRERGETTAGYTAGRLTTAAGPVARVQQLLLVQPRWPENGGLLTCKGGRDSRQQVIVGGCLGPIGNGFHLSRLD